MYQFNRRVPAVMTGIKYLSVAVFWVSFNLQATPATLITEAELKKSPNFSGANMSTLKKGEKVEIKQRERGWYQVETQDNQVGWIIMLRLKLNKMELPTSDGKKSRLVSLRRGHSNITATTGVRGIGETDIKNAKADFDGLQKAKTYSVTQQQAHQFAADAQLHSVNIEYEVENDEE